MGIFIHSMAAVLTGALACGALQKKRNSVLQLSIDVIEVKVKITL
jgi:hypothetical protein